jgi:hypothetical protein
LLASKTTGLWTNRYPSAAFGQPMTEIGSCPGKAAKRPTPSQDWEEKVLEKGEKWGKRLDIGSKRVNITPQQSFQMLALDNQQPGMIIPKM